MNNNGKLSSSYTSRYNICKKPILEPKLPHLAGLPFATLWEVRPSDINREQSGLKVKLEVMEINGDKSFERRWRPYKERIKQIHNWFKHSTWQTLSTRLNESTDLKYNVQPMLISNFFLYSRSWRQGEVGRKMCKNTDRNIRLHFNFLP